MSRIKDFFHRWNEMEQFDAELMMHCIDKYGYWKGGWHYLLARSYIDRKITDNFFKRWIK